MGGVTVGAAQAALAANERHLADADTRDEAGDGIRTHDNHVGNVVLYQLSYTRGRQPEDHQNRRNSGPDTSTGSPAIIGAADAAARSPSGWTGISAQCGKERLEWRRPGVDSVASGLFRPVVPAC